MVSAPKTRLFSAILLLAASFQAARPAIAQAKLIEPPAPLLPAQLGDFTRTAPAPLGDGLGALTGLPGAPVFKEDGVRRYESADYTSGSQHGTITAFQFIDASGAIAAFSYSRRSGSSTPVKRYGDNTVTTPEGIVFQSGVNLVIAKLALPANRTDALLGELIPRLPKVAGPAGQPPVLPTYLPEKGLIPGTPRYALGPAAYTAMGGVLPAGILAFDKAGEAVTAEYHSHSGKGILTILLYPTPTIAGDAGRAIEAHFKANPVTAGIATIRREGPMLMLATGAFNPSEAQAIVGSIHLRNELTWNKEKPPEFHAEVTKTASLLTSILVFCGVGALAAILLGLFLGFGRAGIRVLMGKPAASEPEFLRIDLSGKPNTSLQSGESPH